MKASQKPFNIKLIFFVLAMISIIMVFGVNRLMISQLRNEARQQVEYLAKSYSDAINSDNEEDIRFVMDILLPSLNFPIIITSNNEISSIMNLNIPLNDNNSETNKYVWEIIDEMDAIFQPLDLKWNGMKWGRIHFSDPRVVTQLQWMPYIEIGCGIIFVIIRSMTFISIIYLYGFIGNVLDIKVIKIYDIAVCCIDAIMSIYDIETRDQKCI